MFSADDEHAMPGGLLSADLGQPIPVALCTGGYRCRQMPSIKLGVLDHSAQWRIRMRSLVALSVLTLMIPLVAPQAALAQSLEGSWRGSGVARPNTGQSERVRCNIVYRKENPKVFDVTATCATTSVKFRQTGKVLMVNPDRYVGDFYNPDYDVSGRVRVILKGSTQTVSFSGAKGSGSLTLTKR